MFASAMIPEVGRPAADPRPASGVELTSSGGSATLTSFQGEGSASERGFAGSGFGIGGHMAPFGGVVWQWLAQCMIIFFLVVAVTGFTVGIGLLVSAQKTIESFHLVNRWVSTRHALKSVEVPRDTQGIAHKYQRWLAAGFAIGGLVSMFGLIAGLDATATSALLAKGPMVPVVALALETVKWFLVAGSAFGVLIGAMLLFYPNAESTLESFTNRWVSSRRFVRNWDDMHLTLDRLVEAHPRPAGWIIACTSAAAVIYAVVMLVRH